MPEISIKEQGCITRAIAKLADAQAGGTPVDPNDPDITYCRNFAERESKGQIGPDYVAEVIWQSKRGCSCRAKPERSSGGFTVTHLPTCTIITSRERERAERQANAERIQEARRRGAGWVSA